MSGYNVELVELHDTFQAGTFFFRHYPFSKLHGHALHVILVEPEFLSNLLVREVQAHQVEAQNPYFQGLMVTFKHGRCEGHRIGRNSVPDNGSVVLPGGCCGSLS